MLFSKVFSLAFSVQIETCDEEEKIGISVVINGKDSMELSKDEALVWFLEIQNKAKHMHSLKIEGSCYDTSYIRREFHAPIFGFDWILPFAVQTTEILRAVPSYLRESWSVKELAVNVNCWHFDTNEFFYHKNKPDSCVWLLSILEKFPKVEFLELHDILFCPGSCFSQEKYQNLKLVFEGPSASHLKRVQVTYHPKRFELVVDFEHSETNFTCNAINIYGFFLLRERVKVFGNIKNARVTETFVDKDDEYHEGQEQQLKNLFLELTETMENVQLHVVVSPQQGTADLQTILKSGHPKLMLERMGGFLESSKGLDFNENKVTVELTINLRKGPQNAEELESLVIGYNGGMQHPFSGEKFPYEYDSSTLAHPISMEMVQEGQWIEDLWVVRKGNKVAVLNVQFTFV